MKKTEYKLVLLIFCLYVRENNRRSYSQLELIKNILISTKWNFQELIKVFISVTCLIEFAEVFDIG